MLVIYRGGEHGASEGTRPTFVAFVGGHRRFELNPASFLETLRRTWFKECFVSNGVDACYIWIIDEERKKCLLIVVQRNNNQTKKKRKKKGVLLWVNLIIC